MPGLGVQQLPVRVPRRPGAAGATCDAMHPCNSSLACKNGTCATPDAAGSGCTRPAFDPLFGTCDKLAGTFCNASSICEKANVAGAGANCMIGQSGVTLCSANGSCSGITSGACKAAGAAGATCGGTNPACEPSLVCSGGVCKTADPSTCG